MVKIDELNPIYLKDETKQKVRKSFLHSDFPAVMLNEFFTPQFYLDLQKKVSALNFKKDTVILHHSYLISNIKLSSSELCNFLSFITKKKIDELTFRAYLLSWKDYMILNDKYLEKPGVDVIIDLTEAWNSEYGGILTYTDGRGTVYPISSAGNNLAVVERKKTLHKYIQYLNHYAKDRKRLFLIATI